MAFDHSRVLLPQFVFSRGKDSLAQLYRLSLNQGEPRAAVGAWARFNAGIIFALVALRQVWIFFLRYGSVAKRQHGISRRRQLRDLWYCAWRQNQSPRHYYWRRLYLLPDRKAWLNNLEHRQVTTLLSHLNRCLPIGRVIDKIQYHRHCQIHGLPTPRILASWDRNGRIAGTARTALAADLFLKPAGDYGSVGILAIPYEATKGRYGLNGVSLLWPDLIRTIGDMARREGRSLILQRRLRNAPRNAIYGDNDICNIRIVTARPPDGEPVAIGSFIRLPSKLTTTGHDRNVLTASVDLRTGKMETGRLRELEFGDFPTHPDTGAPIENRLLPGWDEMLELALRGHRTYPWLPFIGWDVVDTTEGLMLLEANAYWGANCLQLPGAMPLGRTRFPEIYLKWFEYFHGPSAALAGREAAL